MTTSIRYVEQTINTGKLNNPISSTGKDSQLVAFNLTTTDAMNKSTVHYLINWKGAGKIQSIMSIEAFNGTSQALLPLTDIIVQLTNGDTVILALGGSATTIPAGAKIKLLLVIGNY